jgi:hypothetical protein
MTLTTAESIFTFPADDRKFAETYAREGSCSVTEGTRSAQIRDLVVVV